MSEPARLVEGALLWEPTEAFREASTMADYLGWLERERGLTFADYDALWRWSVDDLDGFWGSIVDYYGIPLHGTWQRVLGSREMPGARWFEGAELNYAEVLFGRLADDRPAFLSQSERHPLREVSAAELRETVAAAAAGLRRLGVGRGDRVVAVIPNIPEAVIAFLACASLGAIWASCSPDFGTQSLVDRFAQIEPTVLIAVDGYTYGGQAVRSPRCHRRAACRPARAAADGARAVPGSRRRPCTCGPASWPGRTSSPVRPSR